MIHRRGEWCREGEGWWRLNPIGKHRPNDSAAPIGEMLSVVGLANLEDSALTMIYMEAPIRKKGKIPDSALEA